MTVEIVTFGCRLNAYESEVIRDNALKAGLESAIIFNTCAVTAEAERQARQAIRKARKANPDATIIVTGCSAQVKPEMYGEMAEVNQIIGNEEKLKVEYYMGGTLPPSAFHADSPAGSSQSAPPSLLSIMSSEKIRVNDIMSVKETASHMVASMDGRARAFVQVQNGCDHRCTFCIIPFGRGNSRSVPLGEIVAQTRKLVKNGTKEIVLTGVDISDYGKDLPGSPTLGQMIKRLLALVPELPRLRLSSIDAVEVDEELYRLIAEEPRLMPHLHVSLQAGDDMVLKRMKRRHSRKDALDFCARVRSLRPDVVFGADIIAGFPTETEAMFINTLNIVEEAGLTYLHVFPYSARTGTPAARMPQVAKEIRKERAARLRVAGERQVQQFFASWQGRETYAIVENETTARTDHFAPVRLAQPLEPGSLAKLRITGMDANHLQGVAA